MTNEKKSGEKKTEHDDRTNAGISLDVGQKSGVGVSPPSHGEIGNEDKDINERLETLVRGIVSAIPYIGSAISGVVGFFWPASQHDPYAVWNEIKEYISNLIEELISDEKVKNLENQLNGIRNNLNDYQATSFDVPQKGQWFTSVLSSIDNAEPFFFDETNPEKTLPYFVAMGTLKLTVLREQYLFYNKIYQHEDPDKAQHLKTLQDTIKKYQDAANNSKKTVMAWRVGLITVNETVRTDFGVLGPSKTHIWTVRDTHVTDKKNPHPDLEVSWEWNTLTGGTMDAEDKARYAYNNHRSQIEAELGAKLDSFLKPAYLWNYLDPTSPGTPQKKPVDVISGPFAGRSGTRFTDNPHDLPITKVIILAYTFDDARVEGVEIFYGGNSGGAHGKKMSGQVYPTYHHILELQEGESIISARGRAGDSMDALYLKTNKGREVGGGGTRGGSAWSAAPPAGTEATLAFISGIQGRESFEGITLHWRYWRYE
jgi:hypothetical protein